jgi:putative membrane protein
MEGNIVFTTLATIGAHFGGPFGWAFLLFPLFWILVFVLIFGVFGRRWRRNAWAAHHGYGGYGYHGHWGQPSRSAEASLAERFAQGDIDEKEYRARLEVLRANAFPTEPPK